MRRTRILTNSATQFLKRDLHDGEAEAIALAVEEQPDVILLDESEARRLADLYAVRKTGVVGILIRAKMEGKIALLKGELDRLRVQAGFWIDEDLYRRALQAVGEAVE